MHPEAATPSPFDAAFDREIGLTYTETSADGVKAHLAVTPKLHQPTGIVHGGVWCSMVESLASVSAYLWLTENGGGNVVGVNNNTDFLRAVTEGTAYGVSEPVHRGRRQQLWLVNIRDADDRLIARGQVRLQNIEAQA
ncbi:MAG: PaaI family thioesterase [Actinomycetota bacterium]|nr:PaaI family thioesterase [Actinomycetota bacterium]